VLVLAEIAWTHVSTRVRQTIVAIFGVASGVGFTIMMSGLMVGSQQDFVRQLVDTLGHVTISAERQSGRGYADEGMFSAAQPAGAISAAKPTGIKNPNEVMSSLRAWLPGAIAPSVKTSVMLQYGQGRTGVTLIGIDPRYEQEVSKLSSQMRSGQMTDLYKGANALIVGEGLAKKIGIKTGSVINVSAGGGTTVSASVVGTFRSGLREIDELQVYALMRTAQLLAGQAGLVNEMRILLHDARGAREVAERVAAQTGYRAVSWQEANADLLSAFAIRDIIMYVIMGAMLLVSTLGIYSIISTIVHEKRHDIAIMKSFGMKEGMVRSIFIVESALIGSAGVVVGWGLGFLLCFGVGQITFSNPVTGDTQPVPMAYVPLHYAAVAVISIISCAIAAFFPARSATRVPPITIIRGAA
jgi:lipoprotein-releasing system permease protein